MIFDHRGIALTTALESANSPIYLSVISLCWMKWSIIKQVICMYIYIHIYIHIYIYRAFCRSTSMVPSFHGNDRWCPRNVYISIGTIDRKYESNCSQYTHVPTLKLIAWIFWHFGTPAITVFVYSSVMRYMSWAWSKKTTLDQVFYRQVSNIRRTLVGKKIVDHSDVVGASPVDAAPTTSSFST